MLRVILLFLALAPAASAAVFQAGEIIKTTFPPFDMVGPAPEGVPLTILITVRITDVSAEDSFLVECFEDTSSTTPFYSTTINVIDYVPEPPAFPVFPTGFVAVTPPYANPAPMDPEDPSSPLSYDIHNWVDLEGAVRFTVLSGSVDFESIDLTLIRSGTEYSKAVAIPEASAFGWIGGLAVLFYTVGSRRRRRV